MSESIWDTKPTHRFVAFFDIMGFKELVERNSHEKVVEKLALLKRELKHTETFTQTSVTKFQGKLSESKSITFSDSIVIFSKGNSVEDLNKILLDSTYIIHKALKNGIGIKGALSFGEVTLDFENSLFFGRPIIDAYLLHEQLQLYSVIIDNKAEERIDFFKENCALNEVITNYKTPLKGMKVNHRIIRPFNVITSDQIGYVKDIYKSVSGAPRIYVDNTMDFLSSL